MPKGKQRTRIMLTRAGATTDQEHIKVRLAALEAAEKQRNPGYSVPAKPGPGPGGK